MKHELVWNVNRDSAIDKIRDFVERARTFENDIACVNPECFIF